MSNIILSRPMPPSNAETRQPSLRARAPKLAQLLVEHFADNIKQGKLAAGAKLPSEYEIVEAHGVSRSVVREAISRLQAAGLVESRQGIGTFVLERAKSNNFKFDPVAVVTMRDVLHLLELRVSLETESAALAAERHDKAQLSKIKDALTAFQQRLERGEDTTEPDFVFHTAVAAASGNHYFGDILSHLGMAMLPRARVNLDLITKERASEYLSRSNREHVAIYEAIAKRDVSGARESMRKHLNVSRERLQHLAESLSSPGSSRRQA